MLSQEKRDFLITDPWLVIGVSCHRYPFTVEQLRKYQDILDWHDLSLNERILWNADIIEEFVDELLPMSEESERLDYPLSWFSTNDSVPWTIELLERYEHRLDWDAIGGNNVLTAEQRKHFYHRILLCEYYDPSWAEMEGTDNRSKQYPHEVERMIAHLEWELADMDKYPELCIQDPDDIVDGLVDWDRLSRNEVLPWSVELIDRFADKWNWFNLSVNKHLGWTEEFIDRYADRWYWSRISSNDGLPWSHALIRKYEHLLDWAMPIEQDDDTVDLPASGMSINFSIGWTEAMWAEYHSKLYGFHISMNDTIAWDFERVKLFCRFWETEFLHYRPNVLYDAFPELMEEEHLMPLLDTILHKFRNGDYEQTETSDV